MVRIERLINLGIFLWFMVNFAYFITVLPSSCRILLLSFHIYIHIGIGCNSLNIENYLKKFASLFKDCQQQKGSFVTKIIHLYDFKEKKMHFITKSTNSIDSFQIEDDSTV